jgi:hypothetical protein
MHYGLRVIMEDFAQRIPKGNLVKNGKSSCSLHSYGPPEIFGFTFIYPKQKREREREREKDH